MLLDHDLYRKQVEDVIRQNDLPWESLKNKSVMITGAAGMLGSALVDVLILLNEEMNVPVTIYALGRTESKLLARFEGYTDKPYFHILTLDISKEMEMEEEVDYIVHAASNADPVHFAKYPVDTLLANVVGVNNVLDLARRKNATKVVYVSSGEMYGQPDDSLTKGFYEGYCGYVDYSNPRSCYPSGKRASEVLCQSYLSQYGTDVAIVRPCHCYGPTMTTTDSRAMSQFIRLALNGEDIVLKSDGSLVRTHCYVTDAAAAMFYVMLKSGAGEAYNIADNDSDASIREVATIISKEKGKEVIFDLPDDVEKRGFSKVTRAVLDGDKLVALGWKPQIHLEEGIHSTMEILG